MPAWASRAAAWSLPAARWRRSLPALLLAALAVLALTKLGLLAADYRALAPTRAAPAVDAAPDARRSSPAVVVDALRDPQAPMPAAGPEPPAPGLMPELAPELAAASVPEAPAPAAGEAAPPAAALAPAFDPSRLTASEIAVLQQLAERRTALDQRARELDRREALLETAAAALGGQIAELDELRDQIATALAQHDAGEAAKLESLVKIYEAMKAKAAAEIFNRLEMPVLLRVVERMREPKSADVLARMDPAKARQVTTELARRTKLLEAAGAAAPATANGS